jgi:hypothetical protein
VVDIQVIGFIIYQHCNSETSYLSSFIHMEGIIGRCQAFSESVRSQMKAFFVFAFNQIGDLKLWFWVSNLW